MDPFDMTACTGNGAAFECLAQMRMWPSFDIAPVNIDCCEQIAGAATSTYPFALLDERTRAHLSSCDRCNSQYIHQRSEYLRSHLPPKWNVVLTHFLPLGDYGGTQTYTTSIALQTLDCPNLHPEETQCHPERIRVRLVVTPEEALASIVILDVPDQVTAVCLHSLVGITHLSRTLAGVFEADLDFTVEAHGMDVFTRAVHEGTLRLVFLVSCTDAFSEWRDDFDSLLRRFNVVEREFDYILPSGIASDTYINVTRLCEHEYSLAATAKYIRDRLHGRQFDVVLSAGWAMDMIGQRLLSILREEDTKVRKSVMCVDYRHPLMLGDIVPGSRVVILLDVIVTGGLLESLKEIVASFGSVVVDAVALCTAVFPGSVEEYAHLGLAQIEMSVSLDYADRSATKERRSFNPFSCCMTTRSDEVRSPSEFLAQDPDAAELWRSIDAVRAYEHHRVERGAHYVAFIDTRKLINDETIGSRLVSRLGDRVASTTGVPDVLLVPNRVRAQELAKSVCSYLSKGDVALCEVLTAKHRKGLWRVPEDELNRIRGKRVLVVDSAAGYGRTIDQLAQLAESSGAACVGAAVVISRLPPPAATALNRRLPGGLVSLYSLPIQPVVIRADRRDLCPVCRYKDALTAAAAMSGCDAIERWARSLSKPAMGSPADDRMLMRRQRAVQLKLFPQSYGAEFFERCSSGIASGVTLHALTAARSNGMAALTLPEIANLEIPATTRASMLRHLPPAVLEWSRPLEKDIEQYLASGKDSSVWQAAAEVLSRERRRDWMEHLGTLIEKSQSLRSRRATTFWSSMACNAYIVGVNEPEYRAYFEEYISALSDEHYQPVAREGLGMILHAVRMIEVESGIGSGAEAGGEYEELTGRSQVKPR